MMDVLREAREAAGIPQIALSRKMKRTENYINLVENGWRLPNFCEFLAIVNAIGADPVEITRRVVEITGRQKRR